MLGPHLRTSTTLFAGLLLAGLAASYGRSEATPVANPPASHLLVNPHGSNASSAHGRKPGIRRQMPPHGFSSAPPGFVGSFPNPPSSVAKRSGADTRNLPGRPGHDLGTFHGHDFTHFSPDERARWSHGAWRHDYHHGHRGWWWVVGDFWFFYPAPIFPYPLYIGTEEYYDYYSDYGAPDYYWYYCPRPQGYYPYIQECSVPWQPVPPAPEE
jgi:hypothetical protein